MAAISDDDAQAVMTKPLQEVVSQWTATHCSVDRITVLNMGVMRQRAPVLGQASPQS